MIYDIVGLASDPDLITLEEQESKEESTQEIDKGDDIGNNLVQPHFLDVALDQLHTVQQLKPIKIVNGGGKIECVPNQLSLTIRISQ